MSQARLKHNLQFQALLCISLSINLMSSSSQNGHKKDNLQTFPSRIFQASYQSLYWATELFLNITAKIVNLQTNKGELTRDGTQLKMGKCLDMWRVMGVIVEYHQDSCSKQPNISSAQPAAADALIKPNYVSLVAGTTISLDQLVLVILCLEKRHIKPVINKSLLIPGT